ncbi:Histone H2B Type 1-O [Manis pentadactyla]|nr:Histone H2B Type 1-O [Manis pentadactyla]KAI5203192.1 Histone H2B Type 1-O [Manis pentadactyla]
MKLYDWRAATYSLYVYKGLKQADPPRHRHLAQGYGYRELVLNDTLAGEASRLAHYSKRSIVTSREIQTAARLLLPAEAATHAMSEGTEAVIKYISSKRATGCRAMGHSRPTPHLLEPSMRSKKEIIHG